MPGVCTLGDIAKTTTPHPHGCPACPHMCQGPAISASSNVRVGGKPALRVGDMGIHAACCGPNTWNVVQGSGRVFINGSASVRIGDETKHCGTGPGKMKTGSGVVIDGSSAGGIVQFGSPFGGPGVVEVLGPPSSTLQMSDEARAQLPCDHPLYRPPGGFPERPEAGPIRNPEAIEEQRLARLRLAESLGYDTSAAYDEEERKAKAQLDQAKKMLQETPESAGKLLEERRQNLQRAQQHHEMIQAARGGRGGANVRRGGR